MSNKRIIISDKDTNDPIILDGTGTVPKVDIVSRAYVIDKYDFHKITESNPNNWANYFFSAFGALVLPLIGKIIGDLLGNNVKIDSWEIYTPVVALIIGGLFKLYFLFWPPERTKIIRKIKNTFK